MSTNRKKIIALGFGYVTVAVFFASVDPGRLPLILILIPFGLIFILLYVTIRFGLGYFFSLPKTQSRIIALVASVMPVLLLVIQSITQLTIRDVLLCIAIATILLWYAVKFNSNPQS